MTKNIEFWFDYGSASAHIAYWALKDVVTRVGATVTLEPMLLGAVFLATGNRSPLEVEAKGRWMIWDLQNYAQRYGVSFRMNPHMIFKAKSMTIPTVPKKKRVGFFTWQKLPGKNPWH